MIVSIINRKHFCKFHFRWKISCNIDKLIMYVNDIQYSLDTCFIIDAGRSSGPAAELFSCETIAFISLTVTKISFIQFLLLSI